MFISPAYAQGVGGGSGLEAMLPLVLIFIVMYFLLIRPQQKKMKEHRTMLENIRRGDTVITGGGITGKVTKVDSEHEVTVEIAKDVKVKVQRSLISAVQVKGEPISGAANENQTEGQKPAGGGLARLFGFGGGQNPQSARGSVPDSGADAADGDAKAGADDAAEGEAKADDAGASGDDAGDDAKKS
ncbi:MAG: preprotein translocase subunit YajC [Rhodospirillaceae bacterium]